MPLQSCVPVIWLQISFQFRRCRSCHSWHKELCAHILLSLPSPVCLLDVRVQSLKFCMVSLPQVHCDLSLFLQRLQKRFHIRTNDQRPLAAVKNHVAVPLRLNLAPHFVESPLRIPTCPKDIFYMGIFLFSIFSLCNEVLTSFQQSSHHTQFMFSGVVRAEAQILINVDWWIKEAIHTRKERQQAMNRDEGSFQLSHAYDQFLDTASSRRVKNRKNRSTSFFWWRPLYLYLYLYPVGGTRSLRMPALRPASQADPMRIPREGTSVVLRDTTRLTWWCV